MERNDKHRQKGRRKRGLGKARWQSAETNDGQRFYKRTVARHYRRQVCKMFFATLNRRNKKIRLGHTALLDWSVFSWIGTIS